MRRLFCKAVESECFDPKPESKRNCLCSGETEKDDRKQKSEQKKREGLEDSAEE